MMGPCCDFTTPCTRATHGLCHRNSLGCNSFKRTHNFKRAYRVICPTMATGAPSQTSTIPYHSPLAMIRRTSMRVSFSPSNFVSSKAFRTRLFFFWTDTSLPGLRHARDANKRTAECAWGACCISNRVAGSCHRISMCVWIAFSLMYIVLCYTRAVQSKCCKPRQCLLISLVAYINCFENR